MKHLIKLLFQIELTSKFNVKSKLKLHAKVSPKLNWKPN